MALDNFPTYMIWTTILEAIVLFLLLFLISRKSKKENNHIVSVREKTVSYKETEKPKERSKIFSKLFFGAGKIISFPFVSMYRISAKLLRLRKEARKNAEKEKRIKESREAKEKERLEEERRKEEIHRANLAILEEERLQKQKERELIELKFNKKTNKSKTLNYDLFWKTIPYAFLLILAILAVNQYFKWELISQWNWQIVVLGIFTGGLTFWKNRDKIESEIDSEKKKEDLDEEKRKSEFAEKFQRINKIPIFRNLIKWMYKEGWAYVLILLIILMFSIFLYIVNLNTIKFLDTDEGRLFYDAKLILDGKIPFQDFDARSPFIIYFLAGFIQIFGNKLTSLYGLAIFLNVLTVLLIFLFTNTLFNKKISLLASFIFSISPIVINLLYIKTQTFSLPQILISFLFYNAYLKNKSYIQLLCASLFVLLAIFSRESSILFLGGFFILIFVKIKDKAELKKQILILIVLAVLIIFVFLGLDRLFFTFNNDSFFTQTLTLNSFKIDDDSINRFDYLPYYFSEGYLVLFFISFGLLIPFLAHYYKKNNRVHYQIIFPFFVFGTLSLVYLYQSFRGGFWPQYLMEFSVFLSMIISLTIISLLRNDSKFFKIIFITIVFSFIVLSNTHAYLEIKKYQGIFDKNGAEKVAVYLTENSKSEDIIFSGNPIYSFLSSRDHFLDLSHNYYDKNSIKTVTNKLILSPPEYVIGDYYLEQYYFPDNEFKKFLDKNYTKLKTFSGVSYSKNWHVDIYGLNN